MTTRVWSVLGCAVAGMLVAQAAFAIDLTTPAFKQGEKIPSKYTCDGAGMNPAFAFGNVPANAKQLVLTMNDPDVPKTLMPSGKIIQRVSPLASWTTRDVWTYAKEHSLPLLSLYEAGYPSVAREPCTTPPPAPNNPRSGRWQGQKPGCGNHIQAK